jgi:hypothetical protein
MHFNDVPGPEQRSGKDHHQQTLRKDYPPPKALDQIFPVGHFAVRYCRDFPLASGRPAAGAVSELAAP